MYEHYTTKGYPHVWAFQFPAMNITN